LHFLPFGNEHGNAYVANFLFERSKIKASTAKQKGASTGFAATDAGKNLGNKMAEASARPNDSKEKNGSGCATGGTNAGIAGIREHMDVIASCGTKVGVVDHVEGDAIKLTKKDSPDGQHHFIPTNWVEQVDSHVHLKMNSKEAEQGWKSDAASCGSCG
jgi:hypothetical protein